MTEKNKKLLEEIDEAKSEHSLLATVMNTIHDIAGVYFARKALHGTHNEPPRKLTPPLLKSMQKKELTDEQIEELCLEVWEAVALRQQELEPEGKKCHACQVESEFGTEENPHPIPEKFHNAACRCKPASVIERGTDSHPHLIGGYFQSDKYPTTPRGFVPLKCSDTVAQPLLWIYAQWHRKKDEQFSDDLELALKNQGYSGRNKYFFVFDGSDEMTEALKGIEKWCEEDAAEEALKNDDKPLAHAYNSIAHIIGGLMGGDGDVDEELEKLSSELSKKETKYSPDELCNVCKFEHHDTCSNNLNCPCCRDTMNATEV